MPGSDFLAACWKLEFSAATRVKLAHSPVKTVIGIWTIFVLEHSAGLFILGLLQHGSRAAIILPTGEFNSCMELNTLPRKISRKTFSLTHSSNLQGATCPLKS